jgi:hypothetical protein
MYSMYTLEARTFINNLIVNQGNKYNTYLVKLKSTFETK